jgi:TonB family protein
MKSRIEWIHKMFLRLLPIILIFVASSAVIAIGQSNDVPYISLVDCRLCKGAIIHQPDPKYPSLVGYGPHEYNGEVAVQVTIDDKGSVVGATAVAGSPYFRPLLEKESMNATFDPRRIEGENKHQAFLIYYVRSKETGEEAPILLPIINGRATSQPKPVIDSTTCVWGRAEVAVRVDKNGDVVEAKISYSSGNTALEGASLDAARKAHFNTSFAERVEGFRGLLVYNFPRPANCPSIK